MLLKILFITLTFSVVFATPVTTKPTTTQSRGRQLSQETVNLALYVIIAWLALLGVALMFVIGWLCVGQTKIEREMTGYWYESASDVQMKLEFYKSSLKQQSLDYETLNKSLEVREAMVKVDMKEIGERRRWLDDAIHMFKSKAEAVEEYEQTFKLREEGLGEYARTLRVRERGLEEYAHTLLMREAKLSNLESMQ